MKKSEIALILAIFRNTIVASTLDKNQIELKLGKATDEELQFIECWNQLVDSKVVADIIETNFKNHDYNDCLMYLKTVNCKNFPIPLTYITKDHKASIITYYYIMGMKYTIDSKYFNSEQLAVINQSTGICVVNAGPGTGKTATACAKANKLKDEGVIFVSYTNAAVGDDMCRMYEYPNASSYVSKDISNLKKKVIFTTIDSLAGCILGGIAETHDHGIREAIDRLTQNRFSQKHIIVDECQDIDDLRFELVAKTFNKCGFKSITFFGDPRQKISSKAGEWYKQIWIESISGRVNLNNYFQNATSVGFSISYRFKDLSICKLVNNLSARRPEIHFQMRCSDAVIANEEKFLDVKEPIIIYGDAKLAVLEGIGNMIKELHNKCKVPYSEFMIIGPSIFSETNNTSKFARTVASSFRNLGLPCKLSSEGSYERDGILFSTIQSSKGKEADYIFIFGINNYPNTFNMIPYSEAESLIYVVHSRAKKKIFYIIEQTTISLPRGIDDTYVKLINVKTSKAEIIQPKPSKKVVTEMCKDFNFLELIKTNKCYISSTDETVNIPTIPINDIDPTFLGIMIGIFIQMFLTGKLPKVVIEFLMSNYEKITDIDYAKLKYTGTFINGVTIDENLNRKLMIKHDFITDFSGIDINKPIYSYGIDEFIKIVKLSYVLMSGETYEANVNLNFDILEYCLNISKFIQGNFGETVDVESTVKYDSLVGSIDILTRGTIIEIKTKKEIKEMDLLQVHLYSIMCNSEQKLKSVLIDLRNKRVKVVESNRCRDYWRYIISKYFEIKDTIDLMNFRHSDKKLISSFNKNTFTVDTEFNPNNFNIFEIAIYNCNSPYKSIIQTIRSDRETFMFAKNWIDITPELYIDSPSITELSHLFADLVRIYTDKPVLYYYVADVDVKWSYSSINVDVSKILSGICVKSGNFASNHKIPKLIDYYNSHIDFHSFNPRAKHHTALTDSLMLYEILKVLPNES